MPKIKVFLTLKNQCNEVILNGTYLGILNGEKIVYQEGDRIVTIFQKNNTIEMIRKEKEGSAFLTWRNQEKTIGHYQIQDVGIIEFVIETLRLEWDHDRIHIDYQTKLENENMDQFDFRLRYEVIK